MKEGTELPERKQALDAALTASILLREEFYDDAASAIRSENRTLFDAVCERARITDPDLREALYNAARAAGQERYLVW
jgi:hypothetical protein